MFETGSMISDGQGSVSRPLQHLSSLPAANLHAFLTPDGYRDHLVHAILGIRPPNEGGAGLGYPESHGPRRHPGEYLLRKDEGAPHQDGGDGDMAGRQHRIIEPVGSAGDIWGIGRREILLFAGSS
jgi:hypothetical protein